MRVLKNTKGQTMVEFALVITLFLAILFGIIEFGRALYYSNHLGNSVRAAARYGAVYANSNGVNRVAGTIRSGTERYANTEIESYMNASPGSGPAQFIVTADIFRNNSTLSGSLAKQGDTLSVSVTYNYQILTGTIIPFFDGIHPITRSASMPIE